MPLDRTSKPKRHSEVSVDELKDGCVLYDSENELVHILNATAAAIYLSCDGSRSIEEINGEIAQTFHRPPDEILSDTERTIIELEQKGLITWETQGENP